MIGPREIRSMREAPWGSADELREFVLGVGTIPPAEVERLLAILLEPGLAAQGGRHVNRCSAWKAIALASISPALFAPLARALPGADPVARRAIAAVLPRVNDVEAHRFLCEALGSSDPDVRSHASAVLDQVGGPSALAALEKLVARPDFAGREEAVAIMAAKARHRAIPLMASVVEHGTRPERIAALRRLAEPDVAQGHEALVLPAFRRALVVRDPAVVGEAFKTMTRLVAEDALLDELEALVAAPDCDAALIDALGAIRSPRSAEILGTRSKNGTPAQRLAAIQALRAMAIDAAVEPLVDAAYGSDPSLRRAAMEAISALASERKVDLAPIVLGLLRTSDAEARRTAAHLAKSAASAGGELAPRLVALLRDEDWFVRERVLDAIVEMRLPQVAGSLVALLEEPSPVLRRYAIYGLLRLRDPATLGAMMLTAARDEDWWVREQAVLAAGELGDPRAVPYLAALADEREDLRVSALEALALLGAEDAILARAELVADADPAVRATMLGLLEKVRGAEKAAFYVQAITSDSEPDLARRARELLARWKVSPDLEAAAAVGVLDRLLVAASRQEADDVLLHAGRPPHAKRHGVVVPLARSELSGEELAAMLLPMLSPAQREQWDAGRDVDLSYEVKGFDLRFRVNLLRQATGIAAVLRRIASKVPELDALGLPHAVKRFADFPHGLVLVGGPTGSGKSTTLAALIDQINRSEPRHVVTIEDPIEVVHASKQSVVNQREVGAHTASFAHALRSILRQDPDVILVGELRDLTTIEFALQAAETGHLVFATVHTISAAASIDRMVHAFPGKQQPVARAMIADSLRAVCCQQLLRRVDAPGRVLACEVLLHNDAVANLVRKDKCFQLASLMTTSREQGMQLMDDELQKLVQQRIVAPEEALSKAVDKPTFASVLAANGLLTGEEAKAVRGAPGARPGGEEASATASGTRARPALEPEPAASVRPPRRPG